MKRKGRRKIWKIWEGECPFVDGPPSPGIKLFGPHVTCRKGEGVEGQGRRISQID